VVSRDGFECRGRPARRETSLLFSHVSDAWCALGDSKNSPMKRIASTAISGNFKDP